MDHEITLTKTRALEIQASQIDSFVAAYGEPVRAIIAAATTADALVGDGPHSMAAINRHIPRGGFLEMIIKARRRAVAKPAPAFQDISHISEYGLTQKLSSAIRCF